MPTPLPTSWTATLFLALALTLVGGCGDDGDDGQNPIDASVGMDGNTMTDGGVPIDAVPIDATVDAAPPPTFRECADDDAAFVRNTYLAVLGHRPRSSAEVKVFTDIMAQVRALAEAGESVPTPEEVLVRTLARQDRYIDRWAEQLMDALRVPRIEDQTMESCYNRSHRTIDNGELAAHVRDNPGSTAGGDGLGTFTMLDLARSALRLDDLSPVYRGHLYTLISRPMIAGNVPPVQAELARRADFGFVFDSAYLNRDIVCLGCHNSQFSVTYNADPMLNRHWALPGYLEKAVYGDSTGIEVERAHAPFRYDGFGVNGMSGNPGQDRPWDWSPYCGAFRPIGLQPDPAGIDGRFASLSGDRITVYDLEEALGRGFDLLAQNGLEIVGDGDINDPDTAFAYLTAAAIVEFVWREVIGSPLSIANYFPRNEESRDLLKELTDEFIANRFSLQELLIDIVTSPYFNRTPPEEGCGVGPYNMPPVYDPWVISDADPEKHLNSTADGVATLSARTLLRSAYHALGWRIPRFQDFPAFPLEHQACSQNSCVIMDSICQATFDCCVTYELECADPPDAEEPTSGEERTFLREIGAFLKNGERGFRGLDFQARLAWEDRFATCSKISADTDFIEVLTGFVSFSNEPVSEVVLAVKDRLVNEPFIGDTPGPNGVSEAEAIEAVIGVPLTTPVSTIPDLDSRIRSLCGVLLSSPQFLLSGIAPGGGDIPQMTLTEAAFYTICADLETRGLDGGLQLACELDTLTVTTGTP